MLQFTGSQGVRPTECLSWTETEAVRQPAAAPVASCEASASSHSVCIRHCFYVNRPNPNYNGGWFSACDFIVERVGD